ncbi:hypothetical protein HZA97_03760 [Candidatus Woesearchaeota archaeon]|nr:hypothetical protein [Candidatus Woesearchaeota archaeon]
MGLPGFIFTFVLLLFDLFGTWRLQERLSYFVNAELLFLVVALSVWLVILLGLYHHKRWAWALNIILFSVSLANALWLYSLLGISLTLVLLLGIGAFGLVTSVVGLELYIPHEEDE